MQRVIDIVLCLKYCVLFNMSLYLSGEKKHYQFCYKSASTESMASSQNRQKTFLLTVVFHEVGSPV